MIDGTGASELLPGTEDADLIRGFAGADTLLGGGGADTLDGGAGNDHVTGGAGSDSILGGLGNDTLEGGDSDTVIGGLGDDTYILNFAEGLSQLIELPGGGIDTIRSVINGNLSQSIEGLPEIERLVYAGTGAFQGIGNARANTITGGAGADTLYGGLGADRLEGGAGNDFLDGGLGADRLEGGAGDDTYVVDRVTSADGLVPGDVVFEGTKAADTGGIDLVRSSVTYKLGTNLENLALTGGANINGTGNEGNNSLTGNDGNNVLHGGAVTKLVNSIEGIDIFETLSGNDVFVWSGGNDTFLGGEGNDSLYLPFFLEQKGQPGGFSVVRTGPWSVLITDSDTGQTFTTRDVENFIFVGGGNVSLLILTANVPSAFADSLQGGAAAEVIDGLGGNDSIDGGGGADTLIGGLGNDFLSGTSATVMIGGKGNDGYVVDSLDDVIVELPGEGRDVVSTAFATYTLASAPTLEVLAFSLLRDDLDFSTSLAFPDAGYTGHWGVGNDAANLLTGALFGNDTLEGGLGNDTLDGGGLFGGDDSLDGGAGNDSLRGGADADTLNGGLGADRMEGGAGDDLYVVDLLPNAETGAPGDVVYERLLMTTMDAGGIDTVRASVTYTLPTFVENLVLTGELNRNGTGNALNNSLIGNAGNNVLNGAAGDDLFLTSGGNDRFVGGTGNDTLDLSLLTFAQKGIAGGFGVARRDASTVVITDLDTLQTFTLTGAWGAAAGDRGIEFVLFGDRPATLAQLLAGTPSEFARTLTGLAAADTLIGGAGSDSIGGAEGNDRLAGGAGDDLLDGGIGADTLVGGAGNDTFLVDDNLDSALEAPNQGFDQVRTVLPAYVLPANVEQLSYVGSGSFSGQGNGLANLLAGGALADTLSGGLGDDTYEVDGLDLVIEQPDEGTDVVVVMTAMAPYVLGQNLEHLLYAGTGNFQGSGNDQSNLVAGAAGNDSIAGGGGADTLAGGGGNDQLRGGDGSDTLVGGAGNDSLDGEAGDDTLMGGLGDDYYVVQVLADQVIELDDEGADTVETALVEYRLPRNVEHLVFVGSETFIGWGNASPNVLIAGNVGLFNTGSTLNGDAGDDTLMGGDGHDSLNGGSGDDVMEGKMGNDVYLVDSAGDQVIELANQTIQGEQGNADEVQTTLAVYTIPLNVEVVRYVGSGTFSGTGSDVRDELIGGVGSDTLSGGAGDDSLIGSIEISGVSDIMIGGLGNDTYDVDSLGDQVIEAPGEGEDIVFIRSRPEAAGLSAYTLPANIEQLHYFSLHDAGSFNGTGNELANFMLGDATDDTLSGADGNDALLGERANESGHGNDLLHGGPGDDLLMGSAGKDTLEGGAGSDVFFFDHSSLSSDADLILDFVSGTDRIRVFSSTSFFVNEQNAAAGRASVAIGGLVADSFRAGDGATQALDADDRIIYDTSTGALYFDADGVGGAAAIQFAILGDTLHPAITAADFFAVS